MLILLSVLDVVIPKKQACAPQNMVVHAADLMMTSCVKMDGGDHVGLTTTWDYLARGTMCSQPLVIFYEVYCRVWESWRNWFMRDHTRWDLDLVRLHFGRIGLVSFIYSTQYLDSRLCNRPGVLTARHWFIECRENTI